MIFNFLELLLQETIHKFIRILLIHKFIRILLISLQIFTYM